MPANLENSEVATGLENVSFHSNPKKGNAKEGSNYCKLHSSHTPASNTQDSISQASTVHEPWTSRDVQAGFKKAEEP